MKFHRRPNIFWVVGLVLTVAGHAWSQPLVLLSENFGPVATAPAGDAVVRAGALLSGDPALGGQLAVFALADAGARAGEVIYTLEVELENLREQGWVSFDFGSPGGEGGPVIRISPAVGVIFNDSAMTSQVGEPRGGITDDARLRIRINPISRRISGHIGARPFLTTSYEPRPDQDFKQLTVRFQKSPARIESLRVTAEPVDEDLERQMHERRQPNVLMIIVDDLRPELGVYGQPHMVTPRIDRLAAQGTVFDRAYCQQAVCHPSRASALTGLYPETLGVTDWSPFREMSPTVRTLPEHFIDYGYQTQRIGKVFHAGQGNRADIPSFSRKQQYPEAPRWGPGEMAVLKQMAADAKAAGKDPKKIGGGKAWGAPDVADHELRDGKNLETALGILNDLQDEPFFFAVGFSNPHLPFVAPKRYWDLYDPADIELPDHRTPAEGAPDYAYLNWGEMRYYRDIPAEGDLTEAQAREAIHGYRAAVSYVDHLVGELLDELDRLGLAENTVVVLWGDHGYHLLDHGVWCKHTNYDIANRVPLIIRTPGGGMAPRTDAMVELVDLFPTLVEATGLPPLAGTQGRSLLPLLQDPDADWDDAALHVYPREVPGVGPVMGRGIRTRDWHLIEWSNDDGFREIELYDTIADPAESVNVADDPEHQSVVRRLCDRLHAETAAILEARTHYAPKETDAAAR